VSTERIYPRDELPIVSVERPRCPYCGKLEIKTTRSTYCKADDSSTRTTVCLKCGKRFIVIVA
jgi:DNA-directed RNA polymerase subunit M/transcription elongation factor TFIIS